MNNIPIELLMYQLGGTLPSIVRDSVSPKELANLSFDPRYAPVQGLQQLDTSNLDNFTREQRFQDQNDRREKLDAERIRVADKNADRQSKSDAIKALQNYSKLLGDQSDPLTGLPTFLPKVQPLIASITAANQGLSASLNDAQMAMVKGGDIDPDLFGKIQKSRDELTALTSGVQYKKLLSMKPALDAVLKDINNHAAGDRGMIIDHASVKKYGDAVGEYITGNGEMEIPLVPQNSLLIKTKDFDDLLEDGVEAFVKNNTEEIKKFKKSELGFKFFSTIDIRDFTDGNTFVDNYVKAVASMGGGEAYIASQGGEEALRRRVTNIATVAAPGFLERTERTTGETFSRDPAPRAASAAKDTSKLSAASQQKQDGIQRFLGAYGLRTNNYNFADNQNANTIFEKFVALARKGTDAEVGESMSLLGIEGVSGQVMTAPEVINLIRGRNTELSGTPLQAPPKIMTKEEIQKGFINGLGVKPKKIK